MSADEVSFLEWGFKGLVGIVLTVGAWLWRGVMNDLKEHKEDMKKLSDSINDHALENARTYVEKTDFKDSVVEIKDMVKRIHDRLDYIQHSK